MSHFWLTSAAACTGDSGIRSHLNTLVLKNHLKNLQYGKEKGVNYILISIFSFCIFKYLPEEIEFLPESKWAQKCFFLIFGRKCVLFFVFFILLVLAVLFNSHIVLSYAQHIFYFFTNICATPNWGIFLLAM